MFGFNKKKKNNNYDEYYKLQKALKYYNHKEWYDWCDSEENKRFKHLETLIIKAYKTVNIEADLLGRRLNKSFTREDYLEDFKIFFEPKIFDKLKEWCREYEMFRVKEQKLLDNV